MEGEEEIMPRFFLGVDIGGSKSHALIADTTGRAVGFGEAGPGNYEVVGWDGLKHTLHTVTERALDSSGIVREQILGAGFGIAGYDWPAEWDATYLAVESLGLSGPYEFVNDAVIGLLAGTSEGWGVVVVAGTSNNCRGRDRLGREGRVTGCGPSYGEYGGATELVARAIQAIALAWTERGPATRLTEAFIQAVGAASVHDLLEGLALKRYQVSAVEAPLVFEAAARGDRVAQDAIQWTGRELGSLAQGVIHQLDFEDLDFEVVMVGSLFDTSPVLVETLQSTVQKVAPGAQFVRLTVPPAVGGVLLAMQQWGIQIAAQREVLLESTGRLLHARQSTQV
jgi:N-acetylglucosamine kinase-like BadF-type ATPase